MWTARWPTPNGTATGSRSTRRSPSTTLPYRWDEDEYQRLLTVTGGVRRIAAYLRECGHGTPETTAAIVHATKTTLVQEWVRHGRVAPRPGVRALVAGLAGAGYALGVATTGRRAWVEPLLARLFPAHPFRVVVTGDHVTRLKPDPEVYHRAVELLGVAPSATLAVEDSAAGLRAAVAADLCCLVVPNSYTEHQDFSGAALVAAEFDEVSVEDCARLLDDLPTSVARTS